MNWIIWNNSQLYECWFPKLKSDGNSGKLQKKCIHNLVCLIHWTFEICVMYSLKFTKHEWNSHNSARKNEWMKIVLALNPVRWQDICVNIFLLIWFNILHCTTYIIEVCICCLAKWKYLPKQFWKCAVSTTAYFMCIWKLFYVFYFTVALLLWNILTFLLVLVSIATL